MSSTQPLSVHDTYTRYVHLAVSLFGVYEAPHLADTDPGQFSVRHVDRD